MAGLPEEVIEDAKGVLERLERGSVEEGVKKEVGEVVVKKDYVVQEHPVVEELKLLNLERVSPLEALNKLYEMKKKIESFSL